MKHIYYLLSLLLIVSFAQATSWDEPWMEEVILDSDSFVRAKVTKSKDNEVQAAVLKNIAGREIESKFRINDFSLLKFTSLSLKEDIFHFQKDTEYYFFLKSGNKKGRYSIATPTTGFALITDDGVHATYRHSYHQALVPEDIYEQSMKAIYNRIKFDEPCDPPVRDFMIAQLNKEPASPGNSMGDQDVLDQFFLQHVALEVFRYEGNEEEIALIEPFLEVDDFHVEVSAVRSISRLDSKSAKEMLMSFIESDSDEFAKIMAIWGLEYLGATEYAERLSNCMKENDEDELGFGGNIMDPRIGTSFPLTVTEGISELLIKWNYLSEETDGGDAWR
ncbi:MAG: HEAT repeat domain-containing protein [Flavobacteriaceae bacterium]